MNPRSMTYEERKAVDAARMEYPDESLHGRFRAIVNRIPEGSRVLDIACGSGTLMAALRGKGCTVRGIDIAPGAIDVARSKGLDAVVGDVDSFETDPKIRELLLADYDAVIFSKCLAYLKHKNELLPLLRTRAVYVIQRNPAHWRQAWRRIVLKDPDQIDFLPYVGADGAVYDAQSWRGLNRWGATYGFQPHVLSGSGLRSRDRITLFTKA